MFRLTIIFICILTFACNNKSETKNAVNKTPNLDTLDKDNSCNCFDGIGSRKGDTATLVLNFRNGQSISVCGFVDKEMEGTTISEFNVFECKTGKSLTEYDAMQICKLYKKKDSLIIQELKYLPTGKNWTWNLIQIGEEIITIKDKKIFTTGNKPKLEKFAIDDNDAEIFLNSLTKGKGHNNEWELEIGKLEVLTLLGNERAKYILENYEEYTGQETDGAVRETWKDARAITEWIKQ
ncbi:MAG: hypothetical protein WCY06_05045 [Flavobacteriaceae bacterium]